MPHWKVILTYDGTPFNGWQVQPNLPTVQGTLVDAIRHVTGETVLPQGSGRTDTGVHALGQVATFTLDSPIPTPNLHRALNRILPASIRLLSIQEVPADFHARHSARHKTYEYRILPNNQLCSPMRAPYLWDCHWNLDLATLQQSAAHVIGTHDFTSFAATDRDLTTRSEAPAQSKAPAEEDEEANEEPAFDAGYFATLDTEILTETEAEQTAPANTISTEANAISAGANVISTEAMDGLIVHRAAERPLYFSSPGTLTSLTSPAHSHPLSSFAEGGGSASPPTPSSSNATPTHDIPKTIPAGNIRTIHHSAWHRHEDLLIYRVTGSGFLHHMVRNLVGTFVLAGSGRISSGDVLTILNARNRSAAGPTAPARGLFLVEVEY